MNEEIFWRLSEYTNLKVLNGQRERCRECRYHGMDHGLVICEYILVTGKKRPCPPESRHDRCTVWEPGEKGKAGIAYGNEDK